MTWAANYIGRSDMHCWALVRDVYETQLGITLPEYGEVDARELQAVADAVGTGAQVKETWSPVTPFPSAERPFDVVVMRGWLPCSDGKLRRGVVHTGIVTRVGHVMHTDMAYAVVEVPLRHATVRGKLVGCYRHALIGRH